MPTRPAARPRARNPILPLLDLLGRRWALRVLWELRIGPHGFRNLQTACGNISPTVLSTRMRELRQAGLVADSLPGLELTPSGEDLVQALAPLDGFARRWRPARSRARASRVSRGAAGRRG
jgi:DNA-binding HxlR family transcriptional regulator